MDRIAKHEHTVIHSETGSGKTLAYLVPILSRLEPKLPLQVLILLPSRELALQVASEIHQLLAPPSPLHVALVLGGADDASTSAISAASSNVSSGDSAIERFGARMQTQQALADEVAAGRAQILVGTPTSVRRVLHSGERPRQWRHQKPRPRGRGSMLDRSETDRSETGKGGDDHSDGVGDRNLFQFDLQDAHDARTETSPAAGDGSAQWDNDLSGGYDFLGDQMSAGDGAKLLLALASNLDAIVLDEVNCSRSPPHPTALGGAWHALLTNHPWWHVAGGRVASQAPPHTQQQREDREDVILPAGV